MTFKQGSPNNSIEKTRSEVFFNTAQKILDKGHLLVVVYTETQEAVLKMLKQLGVIMIDQQATGIGNIRREALSKASEYFPEAQYFCWLEPEKPDLVQFIEPMAYKMQKEQSVFGIFNRTDMASYPPEQAYYYLFCRAVASQLIGFDIDYAFGPMMMTTKTISYFLKYSGDNYGDKWDSILVPRLHIIKDKLKISILPINFKNDKRMTDIESGNTTMILKRLKQFNNVIPSLVNEWKLLNK